MSDERVYRVPSRHVSGQPHLHTDRDCKHIRNADIVYEDDRSVFPSDHPECSECMGTVERHRNDEESLALFQKLSDPEFGPDDL